MAEYSSTDRNLLIALLAFQNNFIDRPALLGAFAAWTEDKSRPIAELLVEQKKLTTPQRQLIEALATEHLKQHHNDPQQSLAALSSIESGRVALHEIKDADLQQSLVHLRRPELEGTLPHETSDDPSVTHSFLVGGNASAGQRFRILRPHAEGGLGKVSVARDVELNREVALKEIKAKYADEPSARARFTLEAEITGGLEHPGIVPVYGLGTYADGRPYYAMRFIRGDSLKDAIAAFFEKYSTLKLSTASETVVAPKIPAAAYQSLEFRQLLRRFVDVCNAVAYAHARGVLHRDLKPGNIMLGKYGETLVVDWGLAKATGNAETSLEVSQAPLIASASHDSSSAETVMGFAIGTIGYMSPEQAAGRIDQFGPATDIYLLGATLYHILTGQPPHRGKDSGALLQQIQKHPALYPRQLNAAIPKSLSAIAQKAMSLQQADRFTDALELSKEVERWLADEPLKSVRESRLVAFRRWLRKHPTLVTSSMLVLLVGILGVMAIAFVEQSGRTKLERQLFLSERQLFASEMRMGYTDLKAKNYAAVQNVLQRSGNSRFESKLLSAMANRSQVIFETPASPDLKGVAISEQGVIAQAFGNFREQSIKLLKLSDGKEIATHKLSNDDFPGVTALYFTTSGSHLIVRHPHDIRAKVNGKVTTYPALTRIFHGQTGEEIPNSYGMYPAKQRQLSPDGTLILDQRDNRVFAIDASTGEDLYDFTAGSQLACDFSVDGSLLAVGFYGSDDYGTPRIELRDAVSGDLLQELKGAKKRLESIQFSPTGRDIYAICGHQVIGWHKSDKNPNSTFEHCCEFTHGHGYGFGCNLEVGNRMLIVGSSGHFSVWKAVSQGEWQRICDNLGSSDAFFLADGEQVVSGGATIRKWSIDANPFRLDAGLLASIESADSIVFLSDDLLAPKLQVLESTNSHGAEIKQSRIVRQLEPADFDKGGPVFWPRLGELVFGAKGSRFIAFGYGSGSVVANNVPTTGDDGMKIFDFESGAVLESSRLAHGEAEVIAVDSSRTRLAYADKQSLHLYDAKRGKNTVVHSWTKSHIWGDLCFLPGDQKLVLSQPGSHKLIIVTLESGGEEIRPIADHKSDHIALSASTPKNLLATSDGGRIHLRHPTTLAVVKTLPDLGRNIACLAFSPDGEVLVAGSEDGTVTLWDWSIGQPTLVLSEHRSRVRRIRFSLDGHVMLTSTEGESLVWDSRPFSK